LFRKIGDFIRDLRHTWEDGHYGGEKKSLAAAFITKAKDKLPLLPALLKKLPAFLNTKVIWSTVIAALSLQNLALGVLALAGSGASFYALEFLRCRRTRNDIITETNFAGQKVRGRRADLSRLHKAQEKILTLSAAFNKTAEKPEDPNIVAMIGETAALRGRIAVLEGGNDYIFFQPHLKKPEPTQEPPKQAVPGDTALKAAWDNKHEEKLADYIVSLEQALPPGVREKVKNRRSTAGAQPAL
jgi:hypothetical protein